MLFRSASIGGLHIPLASLPSRIAEIPAGQEIVVYCKSGQRSARAVLYLQGMLPGVRVRSLAGGLDAVVLPG